MASACSTRLWDRAGRSRAWRVRRPHVPGGYRGLVEQDNGHAGGEPFVMRIPQSARQERR